MRDCFSIFLLKKKERERKRKRNQREKERKRRGENPCRKLWRDGENPIGQLDSHENAAFGKVRVTVRRRDVNQGQPNVSTGLKS